MPRGKNYVNQGKGVALQASKKKATNMQQCFYGKGCTRKDCIYRHDGPASSEQSKSNEPCMAFLAGECTFSAQGCRKRHPSPADAEKLTEKFSKMPCRHGEHCKTKGCLYIHDTETIAKLSEPSHFPPLTENARPKPPAIPGSAWRSAMPPNGRVTSSLQPNPPPSAVVNGNNSNAQMMNHQQPPQRAPAWGAQPPQFMQQYQQQQQPSVFMQQPPPYQQQQPPPYNQQAYQHYHQNFTVPPPPPSSALDDVASLPSLNKDAKEFVPGGF